MGELARLGPEVRPPLEPRGASQAVDAVHEDEPFSKTAAAAVRRELKDLARWLEFDLVLAG